MQRCFAYTRVSTKRQGEEGVSLEVQRDAIERYAGASGLEIVDWFEETETAAKRGRPVFVKMLRLLRKRKASGVVIHKIDRSARNLRDWADLVDLADEHGIQVHIAHEGLDLSSRGGRLSADIQAVVAADYIRNLRQEARKGFYGRLKQGIYPLKAPLGYCDNGRGGKVKTVDPIRGPLVRQAFELYATGNLSLDRLSTELHRRGLRTRSGGQVGVNRLSEMLNNPFYAGVIRLRSTGERFPGIHEPIISATLFERVRAVLRGKTQTSPIRHDFLFRRFLRCGACGITLIGERQKGHVYYRCHTSGCPVTGVREERVDEAVRHCLKRLELTDPEMEEIGRGLAACRGQNEGIETTVRETTALELGKLRTRSERLADAYLDGAIEKTFFDDQRERLLLGERMLRDQLAAPVQPDAILEKVRYDLELAKSAWLSYQAASTPEKRELVDVLTSNRALTPNGVAVEPSFPFTLLANRDTLLTCAHSRDVPRTLAELPYSLRMALQALPTGWVRSLLEIFTVHRFEAMKKRKAA